MVILHTLILTKVKLITNYKEYKCYKKYNYSFEQYKNYICEKNDKNYHQIYNLGKDYYILSLL